MSWQWRSLPGHVCVSNLSKTDICLCGHKLSSHNRTGKMSPPCRLYACQCNAFRFWRRGDAPATKLYCQCGHGNLEHRSYGGMPCASCKNCPRFLATQVCSNCGLNQDQHVAVLASDPIPASERRFIISSTKSKQLEEEKDDVSRGGGLEGLESKLYTHKQLPQVKSSQRPTVGDKKTSATSHVWEDLLSTVMAEDTPHILAETDSPLLNAKASVKHRPNSGRRARSAKVSKPSKGKRSSQELVAPRSGDVRNKQQPSSNAALVHHLLAECNTLEPQLAARELELQEQERVIREFELQQQQQHQQQQHPPQQQQARPKKERVSLVDGQAKYRRHRPERQKSARKVKGYAQRHAIPQQPSEDRPVLSYSQREQQPSRFAVVEKQMDEQSEEDDVSLDRTYTRHEKLAGDLQEIVGGRSSKRRSGDRSHNISNLPLDVLLRDSEKIKSESPVNLVMMAFKGEATDPYRTGRLLQDGKEQASKAVGAWSDEEEEAYETALLV